MKYSRDNRLFNKIFTFAYIFFLSIEIVYAIMGINAIFNVALLFLNSCIFIPLIIRSGKNNNTFVLDPFYIYGLWYSLCYLISTTPIYLSSDFGRYEVSTNIHYADSSHSTVIVMLGLGILMFYLGYTIKKNNRRKENRRVQLMPQVGSYIRKNRRLLLGAYLYSILFRIYGFSIGAMGSLSSALDVQWPPIPFISVFVFLANIWPIYLAGVMLYALEEKRKNTIILLLVIESFFVIVSGDRRNVIFVLFIFLYCYRVVNQSLPWSAIKVAVPAALLSLPFLTIIGYTMSYMDKIDLSSMSGIISVSLERLGDLTWSNIVIDFIFNPIIDSFGYISNVFVANKEFALRGDLWGDVGLHNVLSKLIPGFMGGGSFDERQYYQLFADRFLTYKVDYSHLTFTFQSELVLSYGLLAIPIGMFIQGLFASYLFNKTQSARCHPLYFIFYCGFGYKFSLGLISGMLTPDFIVGIRSLFYLVIILVVLNFFRKDKRQIVSVRNLGS